MTSSMTRTDADFRGVRRFVRRHPYLSFLLIFNTLGQAVAFVPVITSSVYGVEVGVGTVSTPTSPEELPVARTPFER